MSNEVISKINEMINLVDCNCGGRHQSYISIIDEMLYNRLINPKQRSDLDALRVYGEYDINTYGFDQRLILIELYKQIYFMNKYPYEDLNEILKEENLYLRMKNCLYWVEFFYKSEYQSVLRTNLEQSIKETINNIVNNREMFILDKINQIRELVTEEQMFYYIKLDQIKIS